GGGNVDLLPHEEGMAVAERLNDFGVAAFILAYRLTPRYTRQDVRIIDGQRAIQLVRSRAGEWGGDPNRVGGMGFSAGGQLSRDLAGAEKTLTTSDDALDRFSSRPNFAGLIYGIGRPQAGESLKDFPPTFIAVSAGDRANAASSAQFFVTLQ